MFLKSISIKSRGLGLMPLIISIYLTTSFPINSAISSDENLDIMISTTDCIMENITQNSLEAVVLNLLLIIDADEVWHEKEINYIFNNLNNLKIFTVTKTTITNKLIEDLSNILKKAKENHKEYKKDIMRKISDEFLINTTLVAMYELSKVDGEFHDKEKEIIKMAEGLWK